MQNNLEELYSVVQVTLRIVSGCNIYMYIYISVYAVVFGCNISICIMGFFLTYQWLNLSYFVHFPILVYHIGYFLLLFYLFFNIIQFAAPWFLGTLKVFKAQYSDVIKKGKQSDASSEQQLEVTLSLTHSFTLSVPFLLNVYFLQPCLNIRIYFCRPSVSDILCTPLCIPLSILDLAIVMLFSLRGYECDYDNDNG